MAEKLDLRTVRGMRDLLPGELAKKRLVEEKVRELFKLYGYGEVETPTLEYLDLLAAKAGEEMRQRMYAFKDMGGRWVAMRPEMTAPVARLVASELKKSSKPIRLGYIANCFRYDNPQKGRYREFWHAGFELFGSERPEADAEILCATNDLMAGLGFKEASFKISNIGILRGVLTAEGIEEKEQDLLLGLVDKGRKEEVFERLSELDASQQCTQTVKTLFSTKGTSVERILSEGRATVRNYPTSLERIANLERIIELAKKGGVEAPFLVDLGFARGLEYYTGMIFEVTVPNLDISLVGGGRYDRLVELFGGERTPAVGCAPGISRIVVAMDELKLFSRGGEEQAVQVISVNDGVMEEAFRIAGLLRKGKVSVFFDVMGRGIGRALSQASQARCTHAVIVGSEELGRGKVILRDLKEGKQSEVPISGLSESLRDVVH